jgi:trigger factor
MKTTVEELSKLERRLNIEVPAESVNQAYTKIYRNLQQHAEIRGFRKGKVPVNIIKSKFQDRIQQDVAEYLVNQSYTKALDEHTLEPISQPAIKLQQLSEDQPFLFTADFEVRPKIELKKYEGLKVQREILKVPENHVEKVLEGIRNQKSTQTPILDNRPARMKDVAIIDFEGRINGAAIEGGTGKDHNLELGAKQFIDGFEEGIVGMKIGDTRELQLKFPDEYQAKDIAGKPVTFTVTLKSIKAKELPEVNEEFAKTLGFENVEKLKEAIELDYKHNEENKIKEDFKNRLLKALVSENPVDVPKTLLNEQKQLLIQDVQQKMKSQGMTQEQFVEYTQKWDEDFTKSASFIIQSSFLVNEIATLQNLKATDDEISKRIEDFAKESGIEFERVKTFYAEADKRARLNHMITESKVLDFLTSKANIDEVEKTKLKE